MTPKMSQHARERCAEMGISTKVAKYMVRHYDVRHTTPKGRGNRFVVTCDRYPKYAVVYAEHDDGSTHVVTVLFNTQVRYTRDGVTWKEH